MIRRSIATVLFCAAALLLGLPQDARAQNNIDGSIYSRFGLGELRSFASSQVQALGGGGTALPPLTYVNHQNPASLADQILTRVSAGLLYQGLEATDASDNRSVLTDGTLNAVQFSFPVLTRRLGLGFSFSPFSRMSYQVVTQGRLEPDPELGSPADYVTSFEGSGGLQQFRGGVGYRLGSRVSVGASLNFLFGILEDSRRTIFLDPGYTATNLTNATRINGVTATFGGLVALPGPFGEEDLFSLGATFTLPTSANATRIRTLGESLDSDTLGASLSGSMHLPWTAQFGAAYRPGARWALTADALYEPWTRFSSDLPLAGYTPGGENRFRDRLRASAGAEFFPAGGDPLASYLQRIGYRLGFYYDEAYVSPDAATDLSTVALTGGLSLPTMFPGTRLDVNMELGTRGTTDRELVRDRFFRLSLNVNFGERWFEKRKLR